jgi:hypothetical protein
VMLFVCLRSIIFGKLNTRYGLIPFNAIGI